MINEIESPTKELLARVDERTKSIQADISKFREDLKTNFSNLSDKIRDTEIRNATKFDETSQDIDEIKEMIDTHYIKKTEFDPIRKIVYGFVGFLLLSIGGMFIAIIARPGSIAETRPAIASTPPNIVIPKDLPGLK